MSDLRDPFAVTHKKDIKNKAGEVVMQVDYVGWSQVADRLDDAAPGWSFAVVQLGEDWCLGRLTLSDGRVFENVGYAENAEATWKKEVLKDAVSDALKRCASLAGVARYLYDKDAPTTHGVRDGAPPVRTSAPTPRPAPAPVGGVPEEPDYLREVLGAPAGATETPVALVGSVTAECPIHHQHWTLKPGGVAKQSGKPYPAFWACPSTARPFCQEKPSPKWIALQELSA